MKTVGIIAEYNPFHLGHLYQIKKVRELYPDSLIIAIISTNFTERGEISLINKWDKTRICLDNDIDLVIELPTLYATQSADIFAYGAIKILNSFNIDTLVFGTETNQVDKLIELANIQLNNHDYDNLVKEYLDKGNNYPTAMSNALKEITDIKIDTPNDLLALSYIKEIIKNKYPITPVGIKRTNDYHGKEIKSNIINASLIRELYYEDKDISPYVPKSTLKYLKKGISIDKAYNYLVYNIISHKDTLHEYLTVDEGIENRLLKVLPQSHNWHELIMNIKTKRYTYNKINRMLIHLLLGIKKTDNNQEVYLRILGFNQKGRSHLQSIKAKLEYPVYTTYKPNLSKVFDLEYKSTYIYSLITANPELANYEYKSKPIIKN